MSDLALIAPHIAIVSTALLVLMVEAFGHGGRRPEATWISLLGIGVAALLTGTVCAEDRTGVEYLEYEAYDEMVVPKLAEIAAETRARWPEVGRIVLVHRVGRLELSESSVVVAVSAPHRPDAFVAARFAIDALKVSVPVWKKEVWPGGTDWGTNASDLVDVTEVPAVFAAEGES